MIIAIVSDTHGNVANFKKMVDWLNKQNIEIIFHCGDIGSLESLKESIENFRGKLYGVFGNMDKDFKILIEEYNKIPNVELRVDVFEIEIDGKKFAFTHMPEKARELAQTGKYNVVFYGHTHKAWEEKINNISLINPGELAGQIYKPTFAIYDTKNEKIELKILEKI